MRCHRESHRAGRRASVLIEFALITLVLYVLLGAVIEFGRALHSSQTIQQAADVMARELSRTPLPPATTFQQAMDTQTVRQKIFDERLLVIDLAANPDLDTLYATFPIVNQQLRSVMIFEQVGTRNLMRYPGAILNKGTEASTLPALPVGFSDSGLRVGVPVVNSRGANGVENISWVAVVEEVSPGSFALTAGTTQAGMVTLRINYPFQAATLSGYRANPAGPFEPNAGNPIKADDGAVTVTGPPPPDGGTPQGGSAIGPYSGPYGLGEQQAWGQTIGPVRPFRKLLSAQAAYRREVFGNSP